MNDINKIKNYWNKRAKSKFYKCTNDLNLQEKEFEILLNLIFRDLNGNIALGIFTIARAPKPIVNSTIIKINVKNPIKVDFM